MPPVGVIVELNVCAADHVFAPLSNGTVEPLVPVAYVAAVPSPKLVCAAAAVVAPVPPCVRLKGVVKPVNDVMSLFAPLAAVPRFERAVAAVLAPVPPFATGIADEPSRFVSAAACVAAPVPPLAIASVPVMPVNGTAPHTGALLAPVEIIACPAVDPDGLSIAGGTVLAPNADAAIVEKAIERLTNKCRCFMVIPLLFRFIAIPPRQCCSCHCSQRWYRCPSKHSIGRSRIGYQIEA